MLVIVVETMAVGGAEMDICANFGKINLDPNCQIIICIFGWPGLLCQKAYRCSSNESFREKQTSQP